MTAFSLAPLREPASVFNGKTPSTTEHRDQGHPVLKIRDVDENGIFRGPFESFVEDTFAARHSERFAADGDTLILNAAHNADYVGSKTFFVSGECVGALATGEWLVVRPISSRLDARYINHWLRTIIARRAIRNLVKGIHLYPKDVERLNVPLPSLSQQRRIAAILDQADELRRKRRLGFGRLDALTRSIFVNLFGDPTTDSGQWPQTTLERFFGFQTGKLDSNAAVPNGQFPFFTCAKEDFRIDTYAFDCEALLLAGNNANADYSVKHYKGKFNAYQRTYVLTLRNERNSYRYARFALEYRLAELKRISKGTNTKYLTLELLNNLHIPLPPPELQSKFADLSAGIVSVKAAYSNHLRKLDTLFISLQHRAFSGELTSRDVERELAIAG